MKFLFLFLDGVGLGDADPQINPFATARMPNLRSLLDGQRLLRTSLPPGGRIDSDLGTLLALDACLGVAGLPQSATGQAVLLTGINVPAEIGYHYGPKPNEHVAVHLQNGNLFYRCLQRGLKSTFLNAYPQGYFDTINSGKRIYSSIPFAATSAGLRLMTADDLYAGRALSADFTAEGWRDNLGYRDAPVLTPEQAGRELGNLAQHYNFAFFEYWLSDYAGHRQDMVQAVRLVENFDLVLGGLLQAWDMDSGLIIVTSDHGNLEDLSTRRHTANPVPGLVIGVQGLRDKFCRQLQDLTSVAPAILSMI